MVPCVPSWRQINIVMADFRGANWKRMMSYFTLRWDIIAHLGKGSPTNPP